MAADFQHTVIQRLFGAGLELQGTAAHVSDLTFSGPVDQALGPEARCRLLETLREALGVMRPLFVLTSVDVSAAVDSLMIIVDAAPSDGVEPGVAEIYTQRLQHSASQSGISLAFETQGSTVPFTWSLACDPGRTDAQSRLAVPSDR
jgi:hypothetical protein